MVGAEHLLQRTSHRRWAAVVALVPRTIWAKRFGAARPNLWGRIYRVETVVARETAGATEVDDVGSGGTDCSVVADPSVVGATSVVGGASVVGEVSEVVGTEVAPDAPLAPTEVVGPAELVVRLLDGPADDPRSGAGAPGVSGIAACTYGVMKPTTRSTYQLAALYLKITLRMLASVVMSGPNRQM